MTISLSDLLEEVSGRQYARAADQVREETEGSVAPPAWDDIDVGYQAEFKMMLLPVIMDVLEVVGVGDDLVSAMDTG